MIENNNQKINTADAGANPRKDDDDELSLKDILLTIKAGIAFIISKWVIILVVGIIGGSLGVLYSYLQKPLYVAQLSFVLQNEKGGNSMSSALGLASQFGINMGGSSSDDEFSGDNFLEFMKSRSMIERALLTTINIGGKNQTLAENYISFNKLRDSWQHNPELKNIEFLPNSNRSKFTLKQDSILGALYKLIISNNIVVDKLDKKLSIISIKVSATNELFAKDFIEVLIKNVSDFYIQTKTKKAYQNVAILQRQTDSVRRALNAAISGVASSIDANPNPNMSLQILKVPSQRRQIDVQANTAILNELVKNLELAKMSLLQETPLIQVIDRPILPLEKVRFGKLKGLILGGLIAVFLTIIILLSIRVYSKILSEE